MNQPIVNTIIHIYSTLTTIIDQSLLFKIDIL